ncbi:hypothetical protein IQ225_06045 [Synechocystis salina LEGE 06155]|nr:hypothetical protein [Synechocystis salina LEGE 06155]
MNNEALLLLVGEIRESIVVLKQINQLYVSYSQTFAATDKRDIRDAVLLTDILCNTYTCIETILFRISRGFENHLDPNQWHKELLRKMRIDVPGIRKAVLSKHSYQLLDELRHFRHFKRYYYDFDYDWSRLDYLRLLYEKLLPIIEHELDSYAEFLLECSDIENA